MSIFNSFAPSGGGGGLEYEEGLYTPDSGALAPITINFNNTHSTPPAVVLFTLTDDSETTSWTKEIYRFTYYRYDRLLGRPLAIGNTSFTMYGDYYMSGQYGSTSSGVQPSTDTYATNTGFTLPTSSDFRIIAGKTYAWCAYWGAHNN